MSTKMEEKKSLEQIRKIIEGLGSGSYLSMAFEGCFEMAESNIENDFGNSPKDAIDTLRRNYDAAMARVEELKKANEELSDELQETKESCAMLIRKKNEYHDEAIKNWNKFREMEDRKEALELENMKLKAKLYDLMMAEK